MRWQEVRRAQCRWQHSDGLPHPSHKTRKEVLPDQVVKQFRQREIEYGWVDDYCYAEKMQEIETFLREQVAITFEAGVQHERETKAQIDG
jgi:hypothetical protein